MEVLRTELLEFTLIMSKDEFDVLCKVADKNDSNLEKAVLASYLRGLFAIRQDFKFKE